MQESVEIIPRDKKVLFISFIPAFLTAIVYVYGLVMAPYNDKIFIGLLGDDWGAVGLAREAYEGLISGRYPTIFTARPPLFFFIIALLALVIRIPVLTSYHIVNTLVKALLGIFFYSFALHILRKKKLAFYALFLYVFASSLSWMKIVAILVQRPRVMYSALQGILQGSLSLQLSQDVKAEFTYVIYNYWGMRTRQLGGGLAFQSLANIFGFLAMIYWYRFQHKGNRSNLFYSSIFLSMSNVTHPFAAIGWNLILFALFLKELTIRKMRWELLFVLSLSQIFSAFYVVPIIFSFTSGTGLPVFVNPHKFPTPYGRHKAPYPWEIFEAYGFVTFLALYGIYLARGSSRGFFDDYEVPMISLIYGLVCTTIPMISPEHFPQVVFRQAYFFWLGLVLFGSLALSKLFYTLDRLRKQECKKVSLSINARAINKTVIRKLVVISSLIIMLWASSIIGFFAFSLRWTVKEESVPIPVYNGLTWLRENTDSTCVVFAPRDIYPLIPALAGNTAPGMDKWQDCPWGLISLDVTKSRIQVVYGEDHVNETLQILAQYKVNYLWVPRDNGVPQEKMDFFDSAFIRVYKNEMLIIYKIEDLSRALCSKNTNMEERP